MKIFRNKIVNNNLFRRMIGGVLGVYLFAFGISVQAAEQGAGGADLETIARQIEANLRLARPSFAVESISYSGIPGLYDVLLQDGIRVFSTADGSYVLDGKMYRVDPGLLVDVRDENLKPERAARLAAIPEEEMIIFTPEGGAKAHVFVFTDVDCGYCQKLHLQMEEMNALGIEIRYLAFPRAGVESESGAKLVSAWCADDQNAAMDSLKRRMPVPEKTCDNPVAEQYQLGIDLGVRGTPAIYKSDGSSIPGYRPADVLAKDLGLHPAVPELIRAPVN